MNFVPLLPSALINGCQPSTVNRQLSTVNCQPSTVNRQLSTVNCQPSTTMQPAFKQRVLDAFLKSAEELVSSYRQQLKELDESAKNETKSTAGDKHETALAMLQIEQKNVKGWLEEALKKKKSLETLQLLHTTSRAGKGSLVKTTQGYFLLGAALGKLLVDGIPVMAISTESPVGSRLSGLQSNDRFILNGKEFAIQAIQ